MFSPYSEFVLTGVICIEKDLKGTEIVFVYTGIRINRVRTNEVLLYIYIYNIPCFLIVQSGPFAHWWNVRSTECA